MNTAGDNKEPVWCGKLETSMAKMAGELIRTVKEWTGPETVYTPEAFGYVPGEKATAAIQRAIDEAALHGGVVSLRQGEYISGTLVMRSGVCLEVCSGAILSNSSLCSLSHLTSSSSDKEASAYEDGKLINASTSSI